MTKHASTLLVFLKCNEETTNPEPVFGDGKILWSGKGGFEWIGKGEGEWDSVYLIRYRDYNEYLEAVERFKACEFNHIYLLAVKPASRIKLRSVRFLMKRIFSRLSIILSEAEFNVDNIPQSNILPTKEQHTRVAREYKEQPIVMVNLMDYHDQPIYPADYNGKRSSNGADAYNRYGKHAMRAVASFGGVLEYMGEVQEILIGEHDEKWEEFAFMRYHSLQALQSMFRVKEVPDAAIQRDAGLKATRVFAFTPTK
ncbi:MAG: hypothetical protein KAR03_12290 [Candidatus Thorarchaeota archaeon]|nr:hypothetical protein [Candidatus Thorarchaeota archaeon]